MLFTEIVWCRSSKSGTRFFQGVQLNCSRNHDYSKSSDNVKGNEKFGHADLPGEFDRSILQHSSSQNDGGAEASSPKAQATIV